MFLISSDFSAEAKKAAQKNGDDAKKTAQKNDDDAKKDDTPVGSVSFASLVRHHIQF